MKPLFSSLFILISTGLFGQSAIKGTIFDETNAPLFGANAALLKISDSTLVKAAVSDEKGEFVFEAVQNGSYLVKTLMLGYNTFWHEPIAVNGSGELKLPAAIMTSSSKNLKEVSITGIRPMVEIKADKTVFNVENSINSTGSTAYELLQKSPGVVVDQNDNIFLKGRGGVMVQIDGKKTQLSGSELADLLKSLQSTDVSAIELISNPSAKYDAEGTAGIINIKLKKNKDYGTNGTLTAGYAVGIFSKYNTSLSINNRSGGVNMYGNYSNNWGTRRNYINIYRIQSGSAFDQQSVTFRSGLSHNYKAGADFIINPRHSAGVMINGSYIDLDVNTYSRTVITNVEGNEFNSYLNAASINTPLLKNLNANANYRYADTLGNELTVDLDFGVYDNERISYQPNLYIFKNDSTAPFNYRSVTPSEINIYSAKADYSTGLFKGKLNTGVKIAYVETDNIFNFFNVEGSTDILDITRSNHFIYTENIAAAYLNYEYSIKKFELQAGVRSEYTVSEGDLTSQVTTNDENVKRDYIDFFPSAGITYKHNQKNNFSLIFSSRIDRPNYNDLNPFEHKLDELTYRKGNPFLNPQYTNKIELSHSYNYAITTSASYSHTRAYFAQITDTLEVNKSYLTTRNLASEDVIGLDINISHQFTKWWSLYANTGVTSLRYEADFGGGKKVDADALTLNFYGQNTFKLIKGYSIEISGWYGSPSIWGGTYKTGSQWSLDAGLQKKFAKDRATLKLNVTDIFETAHWTSRSTYTPINANVNGGWESRQFRATLSWRFGNKQVKSVRQRTAGSETEMKRVGTGE